ncbi:hypothetical protein IAR50_004937 [Cryptococcus sp. DSM 104548]
MCSSASCLPPTSIFIPPPPAGYRLVYVPPTSHPRSSTPTPTFTPPPKLARPTVRPPARTLSRLLPNDDPPTPMSPSRPPPPPHPPLSRAVLESAKPCSDLELATDHDCVLSTYELIIRQQPMQARMCGIGDKSDRRPVDPTPIIQLKIIDQHGSDITPTDPRHNILRRPEPGPDGMTFVQNPYYFLFACLVGGEEQEDELHVIDDGKTRFLTGTPVSSLYHLKDLDNTDAAFFVFPDLGVRKEGRYKLKLTLFEIVDQEVYYCTTMFTSTFSVYSAKKFPGMSKATDLSVSFAEQGLKIRVRKDPRQPAKTGATTGKSKRKSSAADSDEDEPLPAPPQVQSTKRSRGSSDYPSHPHHLPPHHGHPQGEPRLHPPPPPPDTYYPYPPPSHAHPYGYPPPGHAMPPPPPPSAYESYRRGSMHSPAGYHSGLPHPSPHGYHAGYYGGGRGRPATHPVPGPAMGRHHQSMPPHPGYMYDPRDPRDPRDHRERSALPSPSSHGHTYPPPSAAGYSPLPAPGEYERAGIPWPQGPAPGERERRGLPRPEELGSSRPGSRGHSSHAPSGSRHHPYAHPSSSRPLSPRSRTSPSRQSLVTSPEMGSFRPHSASREGSLGLPPIPSSAGSGGGRERRGSSMVLPPLTRSPGSMQGSLSLGMAGGLVGGMESNERGSTSGPSGQGKEGERPGSSAGKNKMGLGNLLG